LIPARHSLASSFSQSFGEGLERMTACVSSVSFPRPNVRVLPDSHEVLGYVASS
jgi:hypothetical protein